ncbi:biotin--[acetyl-CoA-carboxylase] ligase [Sphingomonas endolithica]|uniref:biotin--[acetyl-CoA-carboxylase] ligase n=1 Tax=Sphingomonas endolithica TaxID=2972485 RepID=UPI0021B00B30|nr:biotin--[acetyl-CoA-carboxylase] ligase [Sphingomonas sp. ZFBP2030]
MLELARSGAAEGLWLRAERQVSGRGRQGRAWVSPVGNLSASTLVRLRGTDPAAATLALVAAVALEEVVSVYLFPGEGRGPGVERTLAGRSALSSPTSRLDPGLRRGSAAAAMLKWPNDLLIDGAKVSGILLERADDAVVIGIGVNLAHHPDDLDRPTTSLAAHGASPEPADFLDTLAAAFAHWLSRWRSEGLAPMRARWLERAHPPGTALSASLPDGSAVEGLFEGLDADGALILRLADGDRRVIHAGDVFLI